ncbi:MAG: DUF1569 domain-containing protein [Sphingobacteriales bacterium]|nr:DUF1569 domain-containing protein [Sphingobacteriales bacterium]
MALPNIFSKEVADEIISRINTLTPNTPAVWGKMNVAQMLAHCNVTYEMLYTDKHKKPSGFLKFILKIIIKPIVTNEKPYKKSSQTAPAFIITDERVFNDEKARLIDYINKVQSEGAAAFEGRESLSFGPLTSIGWNNLFYKHLNHHLSQFGA